MSFVCLKCPGMWKTESQNTVAPWWLGHCHSNALGTREEVLHSGLQQDPPASTAPPSPSHLRKEGREAGLRDCRGFVTLLSMKGGVFDPVTLSMTSWWRQWNPNTQFGSGEKNYFKTQLQELPITMCNKGGRRGCKAHKIGSLSSSGDCHGRKAAAFPCGFSCTQIVYYCAKSGKMLPGWTQGSVSEVLECSRMLLLMMMVVVAGERSGQLKWQLPQ